MQPLNDLTFFLLIELESVNLYIYYRFLDKAEITGHLTGPVIPLKTSISTFKFF